jgi:hypothetical protein
MYKITLSISSFLLTILVLGCSSVSVTSDYDPAANFGDYYSFEVYRETIKGSELESAPIVKKRVIDAIERVMQQKGLTLDESGNADLIVYTHAGTTERMNVTDWGYGYGSWWGPYPYGRNIDVSYYTQGSLFIDLVDNEKDELMWRGVGTAVLKDRGTPEERQQFIDDAVEKILSDYPPGSNN